MPDMPRNEDGEMELVLGNKQLLSVLFILVVLLGVFFTMGYIVGRNNPSEERVKVALAEQNQKQAVRMPPVTVEPDKIPVVNKPSPTASEPASGSGTPTVEPRKTETAKKEETRKQPEAPKTAPSPVTPSPAVQPSGNTAMYQPTPPPGQYLQVAAIDRPGAMGMAEAYRKQGFQAVITPSSSPTLFRVVIGPLTNNEAIADTKLKLKKLGVDGAILRKF